MIEVELADRGAVQYIVRRFNIRIKHHLGQNFLIRPEVPIEVRAGLLVGFLGGLTTFSSFSLDTVRLLESGQVPLALGYAALSVFGGLLATWAGLSLTKL